MRWSRAQDLLFFRFTIPVVTLLLKAVDGAFRGAVVDGETARQDENQLATCGDSGSLLGSGIIHDEHDYAMPSPAR